MQAIKLLNWVVTNGIDGEFLGILDVPEVGENWWAQNKTWWINALGGFPQANIEPGRYLYFYESQNSLYPAAFPDAMIELKNDYVYLYKID